MADEILDLTTYTQLRATLAIRSEDLDNDQLQGMDLDTFLLVELKRVLNSPYSGSVADYPDLTNELKLFARYACAYQIAIVSPAYVVQKSSDSKIVDQRSFDSRAYQTMLAQLKAQKEEYGALIADAINTDLFISTSLTGAVATPTIDPNVDYITD